MKNYLRLIFILLGVGLIFTAFWISTWTDPKLALVKYGMLHLPSLTFIVMILVGVTLFANRPSELKSIGFSLLFRSPGRLESQMKNLDSQLKTMAEKYYEGGAAELNKTIEIKDLPPVWQLLMEQLDVNIPFEDIVELLQHDANDFNKGMHQQIKTLNTMANMAPSVGILGTVLGLIKLLANIEDISTIGANMSLALMTTLYGIFIGVVALNPLIARLENIRNTYLSSYDQAFFWISLIQENKPAFYAEQKYSKVKDPR